MTSRKRGHDPFLNFGESEPFLKAHGDSRYIYIVFRIDHYFEVPQT